MTVTLPPEYALLLDAVVPLRSPRADSRVWDAAQWELTLRTAEWHRLIPFLSLHCAELHTVPGDVQAELERGYLANAARNLYVDRSLQGAFAALDAADIPVMPLKGAALTETVYPDPALREMLDIDLLVPAARLDEANAVLGGLGYRPVEETAAQDDAAGRSEHHHDPALVTGERIVAVELHHHIAMKRERAHFDVAGLWERARPGLRGPRHLLPSPEDLLLHVCLHFTRNRLGGSYRHAGTGGALAQIGDIAALMAYESLDWSALVVHAREYRLSTRIFLALFAARDVGVPIPREPLDALRPAGFDPRLGRHLVELRVLRAGPQLPVRSLKFIIAPSRDVLERGWKADPSASRSLARAYLRRAIAQAPLARAALKRPWAAVQDYRLNGMIGALERGR